MRTLGIVTSGSDQGGPTILFDDFNGASIDTGRWIVFARRSDSINNEVNCLVPANIRVSGGTLKVDSKFEDCTCQDSSPSFNPGDNLPTDMDYTSGQIQQASASFLYGTVEVRAKIPGGTGLWPCIWMLGNLWQPTMPYTANTPEGSANWPEGGWCEIDIAEFMANHRTQVNCASHWRQPGGSGSGPGGVEAGLPFDATTRFMVYRLQWALNSLIWSVDAEDGVGFRTLRTVSGPTNVPNVPMFLLIHTAIGGNAVGPPNSSTFPQTMEVDYARITR